MKRAFLISFVAILAIFLFLAGTKVLQFRAMGAAGENAQPPPESVASVKVQTDEWRTSIQSIGTLVSVQGIDLSAEVAGLVAKIAFENGAAVSQGDLLIQLDSSLEEAQLRAAEADARLARLDLDRSSRLLEGRTISQAELDSVVARQVQTEARVEEIKAIVARKSIHAPFDGVVGIREVNVGQFVNPGQKLVSVQSLDPVYVNFSLPQQELSRIEPGMQVEVSTDAFPDATFQGEVSAIDPDVDTTTRTVAVQATLANPQGKLRPGLFVRVALVLPGERSVLIIPQTAVLAATSGDSVFVVEGGEPRKVRQQFVRLGQSKGDFVEVTQGLTAGQEVVSAGVFKLRNDMPVTINNDSEPASHLAPEPDNK